MGIGPKSVTRLVYPHPQVREVFLRELSEDKYREEILSLSPEQEITLLFTGDETEFPGILLTLRQRFLRLRYAVLAGRRARLKSFLASLPHWILPQLDVLARPYNPKDPETLTCDETARFVRKLLEAGARARPLPYRDYDVAPRPRLTERVEWISSSCPEPFFSVVIPSRNGAAFLLNVVRHLSLQDFPMENFEVLIVDDGGSDDSLDRIRAYLGPMGSKLSLTYIYVPRSEFPLEQFNAGHCRNRGLRHARGSWILFLDSDMLLPADFLSGLYRQSTKADVIQCPRLHIRPEQSHQGTSLTKLADSDCYIEEPAYWGVFFKTGDWASIPHAWRYTCTYCLAIRKSALDQVGWFRDVFDSYGFEDTELGYRLFKAGKRFLLWPKNTFHLTPPKDKSRYYHSIWRKQILLERTGKVFFLSTLDPEVHRLFEIYMRGESRWRQKIYELLRI